MARIVALFPGSGPLTQARESVLALRRHEPDVDIAAILVSWLEEELTDARRVLEQLEIPVWTVHLVVEPYQRDLFVSQAKVLGLENLDPNTSPDDHPSVARVLCRLFFNRLREIFGEAVMGGGRTIEEETMVVTLMAATGPTSGVAGLECAWILREIEGEVRKGAPDAHRGNVTHIGVLQGSPTLTDGVVSGCNLPFGRRLLDHLVRLNNNNEEGT